MTSCSTMLRVCKPACLTVKHHLFLAPMYTQCVRAVATGHSGSPSVLSNTASFLRNLNNDAEIFLVGTAHVSKASAEEVREMIRAVKPETVFVELDAQRARQLQQGKGKDQDFLKDFLAGFSSPFKLPGHLMEHGLKGLYKGLKHMGLDPGLEFKVALEEAQRINAKYALRSFVIAIVRIVFGDQSVATTMHNLKAAVSFKDIFKMMSNNTIVSDPEMQETLKSSGGGIAASVEAMKTRKAAQAMTKALRDVNPKLAKALIDDRDKYMVDRLRLLKGRVVGVVGLGHLDGMERLWEQGNYQAIKIAS